jgi:hypothetical protein
MSKECVLQMSNSIFKSGESIAARVQIPGAEVADYAWMPELNSVVAALSQRGSVLFTLARFRILK